MDAEARGVAVPRGVGNLPPARQKLVQARRRAVARRTAQNPALAAAPADRIGVCLRHPVSRRDQASSGRRIERPFAGKADHIVEAPAVVGLGADLALRRRARVAVPRHESIHLVRMRGEGFASRAASRPECRGAGARGDLPLLFLAEIDDKPCAGNGTLGHEYTHGVICYKAGLNDSVGSKTINEGYADTIGSIAANDWEFMPHEFRNERFSSVYRSAIDPNKYNGPSEVGGEYFIPFTYTDESGNTCYANEHDNATIVSHAAYLMSLKGLTNDEIAELFFNSMNNLVTGTDFRQAAISLIISADSLSFSQEKKAAVREALYETKMYTPQGKTHIYVHCGSRAIRNSTVTINGNIVGKTDRHGKLVLDFDMKWFGDVKIRAKAKGYDSLAKNVSLVGENIELDFDLSRTDPDRKVEGQVKVTILDMTEPDNMDKAQVFYVSKGEPIDLEELVDQLGMFGVSTDGIKLYFANKYTPIELSYRIHGTKETFDFSEPLYEDVTIEPMIGIGEDSFNFQDLQEFKEAFEGIFATEAATDASE